MKNSNSLLPSFESVDEAADLAVDHSDEINYSDSEAAYYAQEQTAIGRDLERQQDLIEGGFQDVSSLESLASAIDDARDLGMEMGSAQFMHIHLNDVQARYGINDLAAAAPSLECFQERRARIATTASLESVKETAAKVWAWIKEQFKKFVDMVLQLFRRLTKSLDYVAKEAGDLKQKVRRMKFDGGDKIELGRAHQKIRLEGKVTKDFTSPLNTVAALTRVSDETFETISSDVQEFAERAIAALPNLEALKQYSVKVPIPSSFVSAPTEYHFDGEGLIAHSSQLLPGDRYIVVGTFQDGREKLKNEAGTRAYGQVKVVSDPKAAADAADAEALSSTEVFTLCQRLEKTTATLKTSQNKARDELSKVHALIDSLASKATHAGMDLPSIRTTIATLIKMVTTYGAKLQRESNAVAFDVCVGYLTYAKRSVAHAQKKVVEPEFKPGAPRLTAA